MPLVIVALACERAPIGKLEIALFAFQSLDGGLFVDGENQGVLRRIKIKPHDFGRLRRKVGIVAFAPAFTRGKIDLLGAQETPDILDIDIGKGRSDQRAVRNRAVENRKDALVRLGGVLGS